MDARQFPDLLAYLCRSIPSLSNWLDQLEPASCSVVLANWQAVCVRSAGQPKDLERIIDAIARGDLEPIGTTTSERERAMIQIVQACETMLREKLRRNRQQQESRERTYTCPTCQDTGVVSVVSYRTMCLARNNIAAIRSRVIPIVSMAVLHNCDIGLAKIEHSDDGAIVKPKRSAFWSSEMQVFDPQKHCLLSMGAVVCREDVERVAAWIDDYWGSVLAAEAGQ